MSARLELRPYQREAYGRVRAAAVAGATAILAVMPTGGGKTLLGSEFVANAVARGHAVEWYAHREELISQTRDRFIGQGINLSRVRILSVQTAINRAPSGEVPRLRVFDEAHHFAAEEWGKLAAPAKGCHILGLTATPERGDGKGLGREAGGPFDVLVPVTSVAELQALGVLVPCRTYAPAAPTKELSQDPVASYLARAPGERCLVFCRDVRHAESLAMAFTKAGVPAVCIHGDTNADLRRARLEAFASQSSQPLLFAGTMERPPLVICNAQLLTEGLDVPSVSCIILARGCAHAGAMLQMVGRGLRASPGKERCIFMDLRGVTRRRNRAGKLVIGLPETPRVWSLAGKVHDVADDEEDDPKQLQTCPACEVSVARWKTDSAGWRCCPACRERVTPPAPEAELHVRPLHAYGSGASESDKQKKLAELAMQSAKKGHGDGAPAHEHSHMWIGYRFQEDFGGERLPYRITKAALADAMRELRAPGKPRKQRTRKAPAKTTEEVAAEEWAAYLEETASCG